MMAALPGRLPGVVAGRACFAVTGAECRRAGAPEPNKR
jgi:hypothetical protein